MREERSRSNFIYVWIPSFPSPVCWRGCLLHWILLGSSSNIMCLEFNSSSSAPPFCLSSLLYASAMLVHVTVVLWYNLKSVVLWTFKLKKILLCVNVWACVCLSADADIRGQLCRVCSLLLPLFGFQIWSQVCIKCFTHWLIFLAFNFVIIKTSIIHHMSKNQAVKILKVNL